MNKLHLYFLIWTILLFISCKDESIEDMIFGDWELFSSAFVDCSDETSNVSPVLAEDGCDVIPGLLGADCPILNITTDIFKINNAFKDSYDYSVNGNEINLITMAGNPYFKSFSFVNGEIISRTPVISSSSLSPITIIRCIHEEVYVKIE